MRYLYQDENGEEYVGMSSSTGEHVSLVSNRFLDSGALMNLTKESITSLLATNDKAVIGALYVRKSAMPTAPATLTVTVQ